MPKFLLRRGRFHGSHRADVRAFLSTGCHRGTRGEFHQICRAGFAGQAVPGGPSAGARPERDVLSLSGVSALVWLEGSNDFSRQRKCPRRKRDGRHARHRGRLRARIPGVRIIGATVTTALNSSTNAAHGFREQDDKRLALNGFIKTSALFDAVVDFDAATLDPLTGEMKAGIRSRKYNRVVPATSSP
jgi:hypothetical protein